MNLKDNIVIAISKGRILEEGMSLLNSMGINTIENMQDSRKLIYETNNSKLKLVIVRAADVPTYVGNGAADIGIVGKDTLVEYGSNNIDKLFLNNLDPNEHKYFNEISDLKVSSHFLIERSGKLKQFVSIKNKAWHAGVSSFEGKKDCNDFSIGIELEGTDSSMYEINQYNKLIDLCKTLMQNYPNINKQKIVGHSDISPGRKTDPGESFDWNFFKSKI